MDYNCFCINCMREKQTREGRCPWCGYDPAAYQPDLDVLPPYTVLYGKYLLGKVLGRGGFGITYLGYDAMLDRVVAIKEFFPTGMITRGTGTRVVSVSGTQNGGAFQVGLKSFIEEGKKLSRFSQVPGIVDVHDCFLENGTGYIVMEYLQGRTLLQYLKERGRLPYQEAKRILLEILRSLQVVHQDHLIHRDISPDNIFILSDGRIKLLDFGAARYAAMDRSQNLSVILKPGYAPIEQYGTNSKQGSWTDIYAVGATFYRMITGEKPPEPTERVIHDEIRRPSSYGIPITRAEEEVLMKSLELRAENRIRTAQEYIGLLKQADAGRIPDPPRPDPPKPDPPKPDPPKPDPPGHPSGMGAFLVAALFGAALVVAVGGIAVGWNIWKDKKTESGADTTTEMASGEENNSKTESESTTLAEEENPVTIITEEENSVIVIPDGTSAETTAAESASTQSVATGGTTVSTYMTESAAVETAATEAAYSAVTMAGVADIYASSELNESEYGIYHDAGSICDSDLSTAWVEAVDGTGVGESVTFIFDQNYTISGINIWAGFQQSEDLYSKNSRPSEITLQFSDGSSVSCTLEDYEGEQTVSFSSVVTNSVRLVIDSTYSGWKYEDTCISEVEFF